MIDIHVVEYQCSDCSEFVTFPVRAFKSERRAEEFVEKCRKECERIDLELEKYWDKYRIEYYGVKEVVREFARKHLRIDTKMEEFKRKDEIKVGEREIIASHKYHEGCLRRKDGGYYDIGVVELDESK